MNLNPIAPNMNEIEVSGYRVLFSYKTPVAAQRIGSFHTLFVTEKFWSKTTSRHINKWVDTLGSGSYDIIKKPQEYFDTLLNEVK